MPGARRSAPSAGVEHGSGRASPARGTRSRGRPPLPDRGPSPCGPRPGAPSSGDSHEADVGRARRLRSTCSAIASLPWGTPRRPAARTSGRRSTAAGNCTGASFAGWPRTSISPISWSRRRSIADKIGAGAFEAANAASREMLARLRHPESAFLDLAQVHLDAALARLGTEDQPLCAARHVRRRGRGLE